MAQDPGIGDFNRCIKTKAVESIGNSWIVCRSKSYSNRMYYFNTLTGKSAWNLSEAEIKKAKQITKTLENSTDNCPEPREPPLVLPNNDSNTIKNVWEPSKIYNKQLYNNQHSRQSSKFASLISHQCSNCLTLNPMPQPVVNIPVSAFDRQVWAIPPPCQILNAQNVSSIGDNMGPSKNFNFNNYDNNAAYSVPVIHDMSTNLSKHYHSVSDPYFMGKHRNKFYHNNYENGSFNFSARNKDNMNVPCKIQDLREVLSKKEHIDEHSKRFPSNQYECQGNASRKPLQSRCGPDTLMSKDYDEEDSSDEDWLSVNAPEGRYSDLIGLRNLASSYAVTHPWYIVAGFDVLLKNLKILDVLISSDDECILMVPEAVKSAIQATCRDVNSDSVKQARTTMRQLDQWFNCGRVTIRQSDEQSLIEPEDLSSCILNCCLNLLDQKYHVILLCSKKEKYKYNNVTCLSTLTIKEVKEMLTINYSNKISKIPKNFTKRLTPDDLTTNRPTGKETLDTEVQTEFTICDQLYVTDVINDQARTNSKQINVCEKETKDTHRSNISDCSKLIELTNLPKRRILKLPFNVPSSKTNANLNNRKAFKWRRRRNLPDSQNIAIETNATKQTGSKNTHISNDSVKNNGIENMSCLNQSNEAHISQNINSTNLDENVERNASSRVIVQRDVGERIVIEESSSSGFISNAVTNADCGNELVGNCKNVGENKKYIFEVTDFVMEKSLQMRSKEWVSRFVQIMEEVLTLVVLRDPTILNPRPPPWTLIEVTDCIIVRYTDKVIKDAGNKFLETLIKVSKNGNIDLNIKPEQYMEMYTNGVYLIESLQNVLHDFFDLQAAKESLSHLLNEIRNASSERSSEPAHIYSFTDARNTLPEKISLTNIRGGAETGVIQCNKNAKNNELVDVQQISPAGCDWSSVNSNSCTRKALFENNVSDKHDYNKANFIRQIDEPDFFNSLRLQRNFSQVTSMKKHSDKPESNETVSKWKNASNTLDNNYAIVNIGEKQSHHLADLNSTDEHIILEPKCTKTLTGTEDIWKNELLQENAVSKKESDSNEHHSDHDHCEYGNRNDEKDNNNGTGVNCEHKNVLDENNNLERVIKKTVYEIKEAYLRIHEFCEKTCEDLNCPVFSDDKKKEIEEKATVACINITNLCSSLKGINERDTSELNCDIGSTGIVLNKTGEENRTELIEYRDIVTKLKNQGNILLESLSLILDAIN